jgi:hypothetical protein
MPAAAAPRKRGGSGGNPPSDPIPAQKSAETRDRRENPRLPAAASAGTQSGPGRLPGAVMDGSMRRSLVAAAALALAALGACTPMAEANRGALPAMRWDHRPEAIVWTTKALQTVERNDAALTDLVPQDIDTWCPGYRDADVEDRRAFWVGLFSALAKHESTWNPRASGGGGAWVGLVQIDPRTARGYGCAAQTAEALKDGAANLACAIRIASVQVPKDNMVAGNGRQGVGRDWGPMRSSEKRAEMAAWTRAQSWCQPGRRRLSLPAFGAAAAHPDAG